MNPEEDQDEKWEEDTNDTEIMKNINSLLDSGKAKILLIFSAIDIYDYKDSAPTQISY